MFQLGVDPVLLGFRVNVVLTSGLPRETLASQFDNEACAGHRYPASRTSLSTYTRLNTREMSDIEVDLRHKKGLVPHSALRMVQLDTPAKALCCIVKA